MSKIANVEEGALYEGFDSSAASQWCTPTFLSCSACVSASAVKGQVGINVELKTPFGNVSKLFTFSSNVSFSWQPFSRFKITISITNFNEGKGTYSFDLNLNPCIDFPVVGWKCFNYSHRFSASLLLSGIQTEIDDSQFASLLALHAGNSFDQCHCDDNAGSSLLQGDIYSNYLNSQSNAGFPTIPITQCFPIPTVQCIQTVTSCITGISPFCLAQNQGDTAAPNAGFPTIPITQCLPIPTVKCIPTVTSCMTGISPICLAGQDSTSPNAGFPTIPITQCLPIPTVKCIPTVTSCMTGISPICLAGQGSTAPNAGFPTIPITQCFPIPTVQCIQTVTSCITGISPICLAQNQGDNAAPNAGFPTIPITQCLPIPTVKCIPTVTSCVTGISPICSAQNQGNLQAGNAAAAPTTFPCFPTLISCVPPTLATCIPTRVTCFPTSPITCHYQQETNTANVAAVPTLPVDQCVPTVSCFPTLSCIPTVSCTGIPFIC